jgi:hypothetical protein
MIVQRAVRQLRRKPSEDERVWFFEEESEPRNSGYSSPGKIHGLTNQLA